MTDVDDVEMPLLFCLLDELQEMPPHDFLANAEVRAAQDRAEREKKSALESFKATKGKVRRRDDGN